MKPTCIVDLTATFAGEIETTVAEFKATINKIDQLSGAEKAVDTVANYLDAIRGHCEAYGVPMHSETTLPEVRRELYVRLFYLEEILGNATRAAWCATMSTKKGRLAVDGRKSEEELAKGKKLRELM